MRVAYVVHQFFPFFYTGTERVTLNLARQMQRMGHSVDVFTYAVGDSSRDFRPITEEIEGRDYTYAGVHVISMRHRDSHAFGRPGSDEASALALGAVVEETQADLVHVLHPMTLPHSIGLGRRLGVPTVLTLTDFWLICPRINLMTSAGEHCAGPAGGRCVTNGCFDSSAAEALEERLAFAMRAFGQADAVVAPSEFVRSAFIDNGARSDQIRVIRHGVDYSVVNPAAAATDTGGKTVFAYLGHINRIKGLHTLVEAFTGVESDDIELHVYGEPFDHKEYFEEVRARAGADERIKWLGKYEYEDFARVAEKVSVVVLPSIVFESSSLVVSLSLASGLPVVAPNVGGPPELIVDGENGYTFTPGDVEELRGIIERISGDPSSLDAIRARIFAPPRIEEEAFAYDRLYAELAE